LRVASAERPDNRFLELVSLAPNHWGIYSSFKYNSSCRWPRQ
jgi:hypothetical protein